MTKDLFNEKHPEWKGMPEFVQEKQEPFAKIIIRVGSQEELDDLAERLGQPLTRKTKSIWHPRLVRGEHTGKRIIDEK
jgi:hypothetical protein